MRLILLLPLLISLTTSCARRTKSGEATVEKAAAPSQPGQSIDFRQADSDECAAGGYVYRIFSDRNSNGLLDAGDEVLRSQSVCNGENGTSGSDGEDGYDTLFALARVSTGVSACAVGSGLQINIGLDRDRSGALEPSEIGQTQMLCDGENGSAGSAGPPGVNGSSFRMQTVAATAPVCASGGTTILMALDVTHSGHYNATDPDQQSLTICNGADAPTTAYSPVEPILPCGSTVAFKEVLLRLGNGQVLGSFSENVSGHMTRLAFLPDGSYMNTDSSSCTFTLGTSADQSTRTISWFGEIQKSWPLL